MVSLLIHLGDRLGLYRALDGAGTGHRRGPGPPDGIAPPLAARVAAGQRGGRPARSEDGERFELTAVGAMVLAREEDSLQFAAGAFGPPPDPALVDDLADAFRTGTRAAL